MIMQKKNYNRATQSFFAIDVRHAAHMHKTALKAIYMDLER